MARKKLALFFLVALIGISSLVWLAVFYETPSAYLKVSFLDIGQGDAIFIQASNGNQVLVDAGRNKKVLRELGQVMPFYDRSIDMLVATHPDLDHIGGLPFVLERFSVAHYMEPGLDSSSTAYRLLQKEVAKQNIEPTMARQGLRVVIDSTTHLDILFPDRDVTGFKSNEVSIVTLLSYGDTKFLLTGDSPKNIEGYLVATLGKNLQAQVLKAGHHGSRTSSAPDFLAIVKPEMAIIQAGKNNQYGHPHKEVLDLLQAARVKILSNIDLGTITIKSDGKLLTIKSSR